MAKTSVVLVTVLSLALLHVGISDNENSTEIHIVIAPTRSYALEDSFKMADIVAGEINNRTDVIPGAKIVVHRMTTGGNKTPWVTADSLRNIVESYPVHAVIGPVLIDDILGTIDVTRHRKILQMALTSFRFEIDNLLWVHPPTRSIGKATTALLGQLNFTHVVFASFLIAAMINDGALLQEDMKDAGIKIMSTHYSKTANGSVVDDKDIEALLDTIQEHDARVIVIHSNALALNYLCKAYHRNITDWRRIWIINNLASLDKFNINTFKRECSLAEMEKAAQGVFSVSTISSPLWKPDSVLPEGQTRMDALMKFNRINFATDVNVPRRVYDSMWSLASILNQTGIEAGYQYGNEEHLKAMLNSARKVKFDGLSSVVDFSLKLSDKADMLIQQIKDGEVRDVGFYEKEIDAIRWVIPQEEIWWRSPLKMPPRSRDVEISERVNVPYSIIVVYIVLACISCTLVIALVIAILIYRNYSIVMYSWPITSCAICSGLLSLNAFVIIRVLEAIPEATFHISCQTSVWLLLIGWSICASGMTCKTYAIYSEFRKTVTTNNLKIREKQAIVPVILLIAFDLLIMITWTVVSPMSSTVVFLEATKDEAEQIITRHFSMGCSGDYDIYWVIGCTIKQGIVLIVGAFLTWPSSIMAAKRGFNESIYLGVMTYTFTLTFMIGTIIGFAFRGQPVVQYGVLAALILLCTLVSALLMLVPKVIVIHNIKSGKLTTVVSPKVALFGFLSVVAKEANLPGRRLGEIMTRGIAIEKHDPA